MAEDAYVLKSGKFEIKIPKDLYYSEHNSWAELENSSIRVGVSDFFQLLLGDITFIELPSLGEFIQSSKEIGSIESIKAVLDIYSPISGKVIKINPKIQESPDIVNRSPYEQGWLLQIEPTNLSEDLERLLNAESYVEHVKRQIEEERKRRAEKEKILEETH